MVGYNAILYISPNFTFPLIFYDWNIWQNFLTKISEEKNGQEEDTDDDDSDANIKGHEKNGEAVCKDIKDFDINSKKSVWNDDISDKIVKFLLF